MEEASRMSEILTKYPQASGQAINMQKSSISFSYNVDAAMRSRVCAMLSILESNLQGYYHGLPSWVGKKKK